MRFEKSFNGFQSTGTAYDFINLCCLACSVAMAQTQDEIEAMANGSETLSIYSEEDIETYRDVLYYVGQVLGGFFIINREGKLELRKYGSEPVLDIAQKHRFSSSFSDFITRYTAVSSTNMRTETAEYYSVDPDDGLTMNLGVNPLLQFGLDETRAQLCTNILNDLQAVNYVPFDSDTIGNPALNLLGTLYNMGDSYYNTLNGWMTNLLPICPNLIGGILLFPNTLTEDSGNIYPTSENLPVAYASNDVNSSTDLQRGSLSQTEGGATDDGYQFVWEFTNMQGNGTIAAVALTSALGGVGGYGSIADDSSAFLLMSALNQSLDDDITQLLFNAVEVDFENDTVVSIAFSSSSVVITKFRIPILSIGLKEKIDDSTADIIETHAITCTTFLPSSTYHTFVDGHDGYWYGFGNSANSSGSATLLWIRISKTDYTYTEASFTLSNAAMTYAGYRSYSGYSSYRNKCVVRDGYVYIPSYDAAGVYKINLENSADVMLISLGFTSAGYSLSGGSYGLFLDRIEDLIIGYDFQIRADDTVIQTVGSKRFEYSGTPMFRYKNFLLFWGGEYSITKRYLALLTPYLATINNLDTAVVKTSDMTMKITYTLTETV